MKKKKKDNQNSSIKKYTITSNHTFSNNVSKILDELGKTSKNTFNHYLFCYKFYLIYKDIVYEQVYNESVKNKSFLVFESNVIVSENSEKLKELITIL